MTYTNKQIVEIFDDASCKVAEMISVLNNYKTKFDYISNQTLDNADPVCDASEALEKLGILLSSLTIYKHEYEQSPINEETGKLH